MNYECLLAKKNGKRTRKIKNQTGLAEWLQTKCQTLNKGGGSEHHQIKKRLKKTFHSKPWLSIITF